MVADASMKQLINITETYTVFVEMFDTDTRIIALYFCPD
jgi:hypothetical protein